MTHDPYALKLYIDGSALKNPGGSGGFACVAEFPESWSQPDDVIFQKGFHETTNNRMELCNWARGSFFRQTPPQYSIPIRILCGCR